MKPQWTTEWPKREGLFWFYGYRYRGSNPVLCRYDPKELIPIRVFKYGNKFFYSDDGELMLPYETEEAMFLQIDPPELPDTPETMTKTE